MFEYGSQYKKDDTFKAKARLHQSRYRAEVLKVDYCKYGNRLQIEDAERRLIYYDGLGVREQARLRYPKSSMSREGNLLRSEHIPINLFGPLASDYVLAKRILRSVLHINCDAILKIEIEYKPKPKERYLDDQTSFDAYIKIVNEIAEVIDLGIEVKYTEGPSSVNKNSKEYINAHNENSRYWLDDPSYLASQIW